MQEFVRIGSTKKPFGVGGELKVDIADRYLEDFLQTDVVFIRVKGKPLPYFVENIREAGMLLLKLEEVDQKETASAIGGSELLLRQEDLIPDEQRELPLESPDGYAYLKGFLVVDKQLGALGIVKTVEEFPQQEMALVDYRGKEILIPLHPQLIESTDEEEQKILMNLPEGLLDL